MEGDTHLGKVNNYKDLLVWQRGMKLAETIYLITTKLPANEQWGLTSQMRRAAISIPSNIAEGYGRQMTGEYRHYLSISRGSLLELETQILLCQRFGYLAAQDCGPLTEEISQINKMLSALISRMH